MYLLPYSKAELLLPTAIQVVLLVKVISVQTFLSFLRWGMKASIAFTVLCGEAMYCKLMVWTLCNGMKNLIRFT